MNNYKEQYAYVIFKFNVYDPTHLVFRYDDIPATGFSSVYYITEDTAAALEGPGIAGYKGAVWSPSLVIDCDSEEAAMETRAQLASYGLKFEQWSTGNRGAHFYVERPHAPSHLLPQIDKEWVKENLNAVDTSIYSHLHLFRNPGARHSKTGKPKILVEAVEGQPLLLANTPKEGERTQLFKDWGTTSIFQNPLIQELSLPVEEGKRHETLLNLALALKRIGEPVEFIARYLHHVNLQYGTKKDPAEIERILQFVQYEAV